MKPLIRIALLPLALILVLIGLATGKWLFFGIVASAIILFSTIFYSHRKQRVRYWIQGYKIHLENNNGNEGVSIKATQKEFCMSKYADDNVCKREYLNIDDLVEDIIKREFKFKILLQSRALSEDSIQRNILAYMRAKKILRSEIEDIKKEVLKTKGL